MKKKIFFEEIFFTIEGKKRKKSYFLIVSIILFSLICSFNLVWAEEGAPVVTRWMSPNNMAKPFHEPLQTVHPSILNKIYQKAMLRSVSPGINSGRICIVVHQDIYNDITAALSQYDLDLQSTGFNTVTYTYVPGTPESLRSDLAVLYQEAESLVGAVFIGNIPYIIYELMQDWGSGVEYEDFPCDIFYMDLNGTWSDTLSTGSVQANNGKYDTRSGDLSLEIWVSRIRTDNLGSLGSEVNILNQYLDKNHQYRTGLILPSRKALVYNDDDWDFMATDDSSHLGMVYDPSDVITVNNPEETTTADYINNHLTAPYEFIFIRSHGYPGGHGFYRSSKSIFDYVFANEYQSIDPEAVFYSLFVCSAADYTESNNLAGLIAFNPDNSGLLSIGSTKTGGMWAANDFYTALGNKSIFGDAFRQWFNNAQNAFPSDTPKWWYGMVLIGDAALSPQENSNDEDFDGISDAADNCPNICNTNQLDADSDGIGDVCDVTPGCGGCGEPVCEVSCDLDADGILNTDDNCPDTCNTQQLDADGDDIGDVCDDTPGCGGCGETACETKC